MIEHGAGAGLSLVQQAEWGCSGNDGAEARLRRSPAPEEQPIRSSGRRPPVAHILTPRPADEQPPRRANLRERWEAEVWTTTTITDGCRVLLLALARHMDHRGYVSVPRPQLAAEIGRNERRVGERIEQAVSANYLSRVQRGQKGVTSVYRAMLPNPFSRQGDSPLNAQQAANPLADTQAENPPADGAFSMSPGGPACSKRQDSAASSDSGSHGASLRNFSSEEGSSEVEPRRAQRQERREAGDPERIRSVVLSLFPDADGSASGGADKLRSNREAS